jgi:hypothetical protein
LGGVLAATWRHLARVNTATKYVASNTMTSSEWQPSVFLNGDVAKKVAELKQGKDPICTFGEAVICSRRL